MNTETHSIQELAQIMCEEYYWATEQIDETEDSKTELIDFLLRVRDMRHRRMDRIAAKIKTIKKELPEGVLTNDSIKDLADQYFLQIKQINDLYEDLEELGYSPYNNSNE